MEKRQLGRTGLEVGVIGLGGIGLIDKYHLDYKSSSVVINYALDNGINFIETGRSYFDSEKRIGAVLKHRRKDCFIATKTMERSGAKARQDIELSLRNLNTDFIDIYQLHDVKNEAELKEIMGEDGALSALKEAKRDGKIRFIGFSTHRPEMTERLVGTGEFDTAQLPLNPMDEPLFKQGVLSARKNNLGIIIMKPFAGGIIKNTEAALHFILAEDISVVIPGAQTIEHLKQNINAMSSKPAVFSGPEKDKFIRESLKFGTDFCRQCQYCVSACPQNIPIPDIFRLERFAVTYYMKDYASGEYFSLGKTAADCLNCRECLKRCPYELDIPKKLKIAHNNLTGAPRLSEFIMIVLTKLRLVNAIRKVVYFLKNIKKRFLR